MLTSGRLLEVETMRTSWGDWSSRQGLLEVETFLEARFNHKEALRRCCSEVLTILRELCGAEDEELAGAMNEMAEAGLLKLQ